MTSFWVFLGKGCGIRGRIMDIMMTGIQNYLNFGDVSINCYLNDNKILKYNITLDDRLFV